MCSYIITLQITFWEIMSGSMSPFVIPLMWMPKFEIKVIHTMIKRILKHFFITWITYFDFYSTTEEIIHKVAISTQKPTKLEKGLELNSVKTKKLNSVRYIILVPLISWCFCITMLPCTTNKLKRKTDSCFKVKRRICVKRKGAALYLTSACCSNNTYMNRLVYQSECRKPALR